MNAVIESIEAKLAAVSGLKYVDEDWGQLDYYSPNHPVKWPCALIDVGAATFESRGRDRRTNTYPQTGEAMIVLKIANLKLTNTSARAPKTQRDAGWSIFQLIEDIHQAVQGWRPVENSGALIRTAMRRSRRDDGVQEYEVVYSMGMTDV